MEIAHVLRKFEAKAWGGTETHVAEVCARAPAQGVRCSVFAPGPPQAATEQIGGVPVERYGVLCPYLATPQVRRGLVAVGGNLVSLDLPARLLRRAPSLIHVHTGRRIAGAAALAASLEDIPLVLSVHGPLLADQEIAAQETRRRAGRALDLGQPFGWLVGAREVLRRASRVICFNEREQRALASLVGDRAVRMDHGVDVRRLRAGDADRARARWPALRQGPSVVVLGRLCEQKNQLLALRAFAAGAPGGRLLLAGAETDQGYRARIEAEARSLGVRDRLEFLGNIDPIGEVPDLLAAADVALVPSLHEAFGIVVVEAWAAGVPALFARSSGTEDLASALQCPDAAPEGYLVEAWGDALRSLLADPGRRRALQQRAGALVDRRFGWDRVVASLADLYRQIVEEQRLSFAEGWT
ncbi:MAG: glycosyltransferase family 4 protein [Polyangiaceae bacterium]|jgi:glycosyltransferase involved in cell wall biosynthesis|nr:glycosyltransferase family 4 protein [Polyangiaceae bacterium]